MGNSHSTQEDELKIKYQELSKEKKGYAILLGNEPLDSTKKEETVGTRLSYLEESLTAVGVIEVMTPFMTQGGSSDTRTAGFTKDQFQRVLLMHFDADMLRNLSRYSCYCAIYCGCVSQDGVLTKSNQVIPFVEIISSICYHSSGHGKPTIFIFDCLFETTTPPNIAVVMDTLMENLHPLPNDVLVCLTGQTARPDEPPGVFTLEFAQIYEEFSHYLTLPALLLMTGLKVSLTSGSHIVQRPAIWNTLTDELTIGASDPSIPTINDTQTWTTYCCNVIKKHSSAPLPKPDATPGCGRRVFIIYASDSCRRGLESSPIWSLGVWLTSLGFDVFLDAPDPQENTSSWCSWYSTHILSCRNIVLVCSPLMASAFNDIPAPSVPERYLTAAQLMCSTLRGLQGSEAKGSLRFFPVLFSSVPNVESVPKFFSGGNIYDLTRDSGPPVDTSFDSQRVRSTYDTLVFHISRLPVPATPTSVKETVTDEMIDELLTLKEGYIPVSHTPPVTNIPPTIVPVTPVPAPPTTVPPTNRVTILSPLTASQEVDQSTFLWLAQRVAEWKFMGRHLGVPEYQLTHIERENPHSISEQVIQMLYDWRKATLDEAATNQKLLDSLKFAETSRMCDEFINYLEKKQF